MSEEETETPEVGSPPGHGVSREERTWAMAAHLSALLGFVVPFGNLIGPLVVWLLKKEEMPLVADQGKEALNFQITMFIAFMVAFLLVFVVIGYFLIWLLAIYAIVVVIIATVKANDGIAYRYPFTLRLIK